MHFLYIDETGDTGADLLNIQQPIFVMGGIAVSDEKWYSTQNKFGSIINSYFSGAPPANFELHAHELLSPAGNGPFAGHNRSSRNQLAFDILNILIDHNHNVHLIAFSKPTLHANACGVVTVFDTKSPYLLGFDYLITQFNNHLSQKLGRSARGMIILDKKECHHNDIEIILHYRRFIPVAAHRVKRVVEFSYPIDSTKNPMIQISDLIIFCVRKFLECEHGFGAAWPQPAKDFFASCYNIIDDRLTFKTGIINRTEPQLRQLNDYILTVNLKPRVQWRRNYTIT